MTDLAGGAHKAQVGLGHKAIVGERRVGRGEVRQGWNKGLDKCEGKL